MLYHAIYVSPNTSPPPRNIIHKPELCKAVEGWGRIDDFGFITIDSIKNIPMGAGWIRLYKSNNRGYGYVDDETPELTIALLPQYRGRGIGTALLQKLLTTASTQYPAISLSVSPENDAVRLYKQFGFQEVGECGTSITMLLRF